MRLDSLFRQLDARGMPPLDQWDPAFCGDMDLLITAGGEWIHEGAPIRRPELVRLLASVLRRESDGDYYLVTPAEKLRIRVEDRPLLAVDAEADADGWCVDLQWGERLRLGAAHRLHLASDPQGEWRPALPVRHGLEARLHRNLYYRLVEVAEWRGAELGLTSDGVWQPMGRLAEGEA
ncbi:hypothetical protein GY26_03605 [Gammaproteobacteria bacterium MFB021]|nr:hypothetical protein GY26_03605 [Gammaproteobacteria bacterium MFB021]